MSRFFSDKYAGLQAYTPGEQPRDMQYVKLNTNESPFPPPRAAIEAAARAAERMHLYCDPDCTELTKALAGYFDADREQILVTNGSDEILHFAFMAFCDDGCPALFPDITYGFYPVFAELERVPVCRIPLREDFTVDPEPYRKNTGTVFLANPNANTGIALSSDQIEEILKANPDHVVVIDEAYGDFGADSVIPLTKRYGNLLVTRTFSKGWSMAGARLGIGIGSPAIMADLNTVKYSTDPYNVNVMTQAAGIGALRAAEEIRENCARIVQNRQWTEGELTRRGFTLTDSRANFVFARHEKRNGQELYEMLKANGVLVRHFGSKRISDYIRITIGSRPQMERLMEEIDAALAEESGRHA